MKTVIIRNIAPKCVPSWSAWGDLLCRMANIDTLIIDPLAKRPKNSAMTMISITLLKEI